MNAIIDVLMKRDKLSFKEAQDIFFDLKDKAERILESDCSLLDLEDLLSDEVGLEPDYLSDLIDL